MLIDSGKFKAGTETFATNATGNVKDKKDAKALRPLAVCAGNPGSGAGREIRNMPKKIMGCFVMGLKKTEKVPHQVFHRPSVPVGFYSSFN
jgi:hypothetical protein